MDSPASPPSQLRQTLISHRPGSAAWGASALALWSLGPHPVRPVIATAHPRRSSIQCREVAVSSLDLLPTTEVGGIRTATVELAIASVALSMPLRSLDELVDLAIRRSLTAYPRLRHGIGLLHRTSILGDWRPLDSSPGPPSLPAAEWTSEFAQRLDAAGLGRPEIGYRIVDRRGEYLGTPRLAYPRARLAIELDPLGLRPLRPILGSQRGHHRRLTEADWVTAHFRWDQFIDEWPWVIAVLAAQLGLAQTVAASGATQPVTLTPTFRELVTLTPTSGAHSHQLRKGGAHSHQYEPASGRQSTS